MFDRNVYVDQRGEKPRGSSVIYDSGMPTGYTE